MLNTIDLNEVPESHILFKNETRTYFVTQNHFGQFWIVRHSILNDDRIYQSTVGEKPFKTIKGATNYLNRYLAKWGL